MKIELKKHQDHAVADAMLVLATSPRATVVMPCGTGKTLVGAAVAEKIAGLTTVILVPSLALIKQTIESWRAAQVIQAAEYVAVCSDNSVAEDDDIVAAEVGTDVLMEPGALRRRIEHAHSRGAPVVVVTTYVSAAVVGQALREAGIEAAFALYDEAHRTATGAPSVYGSSLLDSVLPARKRLFLTATPRIDPTMEFGVDTLSMDNETIYGPIAHALPMSEAVAEGLIVDYKILISVITTTELETLSVVRENMHEHAAAMAIGKAMREFGLKKGFLFHRRVADAERFARTPELAREAGALASFVSGEMNSAERTRRMRSFDEAPLSLMSNAKCLTEGVDSPAVDMVVFMSPKRSLTDIVQATGRVLRVAAGKQCGYVLLPLLVDISGGETISEALKRSDMSEIANVLSELRGMETPIARIKRRSQGVASKEDIAAALEFVEHKLTVLSDPALESDIRESIRVITMRDLRTPFEEKFAFVKAYIEEHGHVQFSYGSSENQEKIGKFVSNCRTMKKNGTLSKRNVELLDGIGFPWTMEEHDWLLGFATSRGNWQGAHSEWEEQQRLALAEKRLTAARFEKLAAAGFDFYASRQNAPMLASTLPSPSRKEMTRAQLVEAAMRGVEEQGQRQSLRRLANATGMSATTVARVLKEMGRDTKPVLLAPGPQMEEDDPRLALLIGKDFHLTPERFLTSVAELAVALSQRAPSGRWTIRQLNKETYITKPTIVTLLNLGFGVWCDDFDQPLQRIRGPLHPDEVHEVFGDPEPLHMRERQA